MGFVFNFFEDFAEVDQTGLVEMGVGAHFFEIADINVAGGTPLFDSGFLKLIVTKPTGDPSQVEIHDDRGNVLVIGAGAGSSFRWSQILLAGRTSGTTNPQISDGAELEFERGGNVLTVDAAPLAGSNTVTLPDPLGPDTIVFQNLAQSLSNKTLVTPTIASFINATHDHLTSAGGGILSVAALSDLSLDSAYDGGSSINIDAGPFQLVLPASTISAETNVIDVNTSPTVVVDTTFPNQRFASFRAPVLSINTGVTLTNAATVYIAGAPSNIGLGSLTNPYSLWVDAGLVQFDDDLNVGGTVFADEVISGDIGFHDPGCYICGNEFAMDDTIVLGVVKVRPGPLTYTQPVHFECKTLRKTIN